LKIGGYLLGISRFVLIQVNLRVKALREGKPISSNREKFSAGACAKDTSREGYRLSSRDPEEGRGGEGTVGASIWGLTEESICEPFVRSVQTTLEVGRAAAAAAGALLVAGGGAPRGCACRGRAPAPLATRLALERFFVHSLRRRLINIK